MQHQKMFVILVLAASLIVLAFGSPFYVHARSTITIVNLDTFGEGFNDGRPPDVASTAGGNSGATLGEQRLIAFRFAADIWSRLFESRVEIRVGANFDPLFCDDTSAVLGSAGPNWVHRDFTGAPVANTWYPAALANSIAQFDLNPTGDDIGANFNSSIGTTCAFPTVWYYGLDGDAPADTIDFVTVALHELTHGLGFLTFVDLSTGATLFGFDDTFMLNLQDHSTGKLYPEMTDAERVTASTNTGNLHWVGPNVIAENGGPVEMYAPATQDPGSSVSHFSTSLSPDELMEPSYTGANHNVGLAEPLLEDIGWVPADDIDSNRLYFPHIASNKPWETEICLINRSSSETARGSLRTYDHHGDQISSDLSIELKPHSRREITIGQAFSEAQDIAYAVFFSDSENICGYIKFYQQGKYRVAVPATSEINSGIIYIPHIASNSDWWTGISLLNTTPVQKNILIEFNTGQTIHITLAANQHQAFTIKTLFNNLAQPQFESAVIKNASGIIGLELFGSSDSSFQSYLSGILLEDDATTDIYFPHVASDSQWWTGVVAYNPADQACDLTITAYDQAGSFLSSSNIRIDGKRKFIGSVGNLGFPAQTAWFRINATLPVTGFELFGTRNGKQLAGYTGVGIKKKEGIFPKIDQEGWTGIAFVNTEDSNNSVAIAAYNDHGDLISSESFILYPHEKVVEVATNLFSQDIGDATYITYSTSSDVAGFQLNGSSDGMMLDALPGIY